MLLSTKIILSVFLLMVLIALSKSHKSTFIASNQIETQSNNLVMTDQKLEMRVQRALHRAMKIYPELQTVPIKIVLRNEPTCFSSRPQTRSLISSQRSYSIALSSRERCIHHIRSLSVTALDGWIIHEASHVKDYESMTRFEVLRFALGYMFSGDFRKATEHRVNSLAIDHGAGEKIERAHFENAHSEHFSDRYKEYFNKTYLPLPATD